MAAWIEREIKLLLPDRDAYDRVLRALGPTREALQVNHFLDRSDGALRRERIGVRLRSEDAQRLLTLKGDARSGRGSALVERIELELPISDAVFEAALARGLDLEPWLAPLARSGGADPVPVALEAFLARVRALVSGRWLAPTAHFENRRRTARITLADAREPGRGAVALTLQLDETRFPDGRIDFEVEVELDDAGPDALRAQDALRHWLEALGAGELVAASSKLARLYAPHERSSDSGA